MTREEKIYLELYRMGLWADVEMGNHDFDSIKEFNWQEIFNIAQKQATIGVIAEAFNIINDREDAYSKAVMSAVDKGVLRKFAFYYLQIEQANRKMNAVLEQLFSKLNREDIKAYLLKGQGVAECYAKPLVRQSGDIDLYAPDEEMFNRTQLLLDKKIKKLEELNLSTLEVVYEWNGVIVELHGKIVSGINCRFNKRFKIWQKFLFSPICQNEIDNTDIEKTQKWLRHLPPVRFDVVFIFVHLVRHYFAGGIGFRQIGDWMRFLYCNKEKIDKDSLIEDLNYLGLKHVWEVFATMAVCYLGCPKEIMPLWNVKYEKYAVQVLQYIFQGGNFGYHDMRSLSQSHFLIIRKLKAFWGNLRKILRNIRMFPQESFYALPEYVASGIKRLGQ